MIKHPRSDRNGDVFDGCQCESNIFAKFRFRVSLFIRFIYKCMLLGRIDVQNEEFCSLDSLAKILRRIAPQDDIVLLTNILTKKFRFIGKFIVSRRNIPLSRGNVSEADKGVACSIKIARFSKGATPE